MKRWSLTYRILFGLILGMLLGMALNLAGNAWTEYYIVGGFFHIGGQAFFSALRLLVVPVVFFSLVCGVTSLDSSLRQVGRIGVKTLALYMFTTATAITMALIAATFTNPGKGFELISSAEFDAQAAPTLSEVVIGFIPTNPLQAMAEGNMIQIIVLAILIGISITRSGDAGPRLKSMFEDFNEMSMRLVAFIIELAPYGVFFLIAKVFAEQGFEAIAPLSKYFFTVIAVIFAHGILTHSSLLLVMGFSPRQFLRRMREVMVFSFSTSSSNATLPVSLEAVETRLGVKNSVASFTMPLGATINMDGTAIMQGVATVFISQAYGVDIGLMGYLTVIGMATLASIGTAGVPGVGLITLAMVLNQVGLPVEGIGLIIGVDRILDMLRTSLNVNGDAVVTCVVAKTENQIDPEIAGDFLVQSEAVRR